FTSADYSLRIYQFPGQEDQPVTLQLAEDLGRLLGCEYCTGWVTRGQQVLTIDEQSNQTVKDSDFPDEVVEFFENGTLSSITAREPILEPFYGTTLVLAPYSRAEFYPTGHVEEGSL